MILINDRYGDRTPIANDDQNNKLTMVMAFSVHAGRVKQRFRVPGGSAGGRAKSLCFNGASSLFVLLRALNLKKLCVSVLKK
jgi:hypothetical protein